MRKILCISCGLIFSLLIISAKCNSSTSPEGTRLTLDFEGTWT